MIAEQSDTSLMKSVGFVFCYEECYENCYDEISESRRKPKFSNSGRGDRIRTCDPLVPNQMRYQAAPLPESDGALDRIFTFVYPADVAINRA